MAGNANIHKRKDGRWEARLSLGIDPRTGKTKYKSLYAPTMGEVRKRLKEAERKLEYGISVDADKITVETWMDKWLADYKRQRVQPTTYEGYQYNIRHIKSALGKLKLRGLKPEHVQAFVNELQNEGKMRTLKISHTLLCAALDQAVKNDYIIKNPARMVVLPKQERKEAKVLTPDEQKWFLKALEGERLRYLFMFQLCTGLRPGEVLGLTWDNIDFENRILHVEKAVRSERIGDQGKHALAFAPTKTKRKREVELLDEAIQVLLRQKEAQRQEQSFMGSGYANVNLVFATQLGTMLDRNNLDAVLKRIKRNMRKIAAEEKGVEADQIQITDFTAHSMRHTFATRALEKDIPLKVVADWLGHSTIRVTGDTYSHALPEKRRTSIERLNGLLEV